MGKILDAFSRKARLVNPTYERDLHKTYLTAAEWRNVEMSEEYAAFLKNGEAFYRYPFFRQLLIFWQVFFKSYAKAHEAESHLQLIFSEYMLMNLFIAVNTSLEFFAKGLVSMLLWPLLPKYNMTFFQRELADLFEDYGKFIHHTPFYSYPYFSKLGALCTAFWNSPRKSFIDVLSLIAVAVDFLAHGIISAPVAIWCQQGPSKAAETIDILVKLRSTGEAPYLLREKLKQIVLANPEVSLVQADNNDCIETEYKEYKGCSYAYAQLRLPRYEAFQTAAEQLLQAGLVIKEVAGQRKMQVKCLVEADSELELSERQSKLTALSSVSTNYSYQDGIHSQLSFFALDVPVSHLKPAMEAIAALEGTKLRFIHDF